MSRRPHNTGTWGKIGLYVAIVLIIALAIGWMNACAPVEPVEPTPPPAPPAPPPAPVVTLPDVTEWHILYCAETGISGPRQMAHGVIVWDNTVRRHLGKPELNPPCPLEPKE